MTKCLHFISPQLSKLVKKPASISKQDYQSSKPSSSRTTSGDRDRDPPRRPYWKEKRAPKRRKSQEDKRQPEGSSKAKKPRKEKPYKKKEGESRDVLDNILKLTLATDFLSAYGSGSFSATATAMVESAGLSLSGTYETAQLPIAGRLKSRLLSWKQITNNTWALSVVSEGLKFHWKKGCPTTPHRKGNPPLDQEAKAILDGEVEAMLQKGAIHEVESSEDEVISSFFARPKRTPGKWRPICSLLHTNSFIRKVPFRMTTAKMLRSWIKPGHYFVSIDLQDAYFSIPLAEAMRRFCRFKWRGRVYEYLCMMFGIGPSARVFTKIVKVVLAFLRRSFNTEIAGYIDDLLVMAATVLECLLQAQVVILVFQALGFSVNFEKSMLTPSRSVEHLGFIWHSETMQVSLPDRKISQITETAARFLEDGVVSVPELRSLLGRLESIRLVTEQGPLHYRSLQRLIPRQETQDSQRLLLLSSAAREDLVWWRDSFPFPAHTSSPLRRPPVTLALSTDASGEFGWGGHNATDFVQGRWSREDLATHINLKELRAAHYTIEHFMSKGDHVHLTMDSSCAVAYVNKMGGTRSSYLCKEALAIWDLVLARKGWISAYWVPREENEASDLLSKSPIQTWEFGLLPTTASLLWTTFFHPVLDLFASRQFHLLPQYCSWLPDQQALTGDAFSLPRWPDKAYAFPPVPLIRKTLEKIQQDEITAIIVVPDWDLSLWWDTLQDMLVTSPLTLGWYKDVTHANPGVEQPHMGYLLACLVGPSRVTSPSSVTRQQI